MQQIGVNHLNVNHINENFIDSSDTFHPTEEKYTNHIQATCTGKSSRLLRNIWSSVTRRFRKDPHSTNSRPQNYGTVDSVLTPYEDVNQKLLREAVDHDPRRNCDLQTKTSANSSIPTPLPIINSEISQMPEKPNTALPNSLGCPVPPPNASRSILEVSEVAGDHQINGHSAGGTGSVVVDRPGLLQSMHVQKCTRARRPRLSSLSGLENSRYSSTFAPSELGPSEELRCENRRMLRDLQSVKLVLIKLRRLLAEDQWVLDQVSEGSGSLSLQDQPIPTSNHISTAHLATAPDMHGVPPHDVTEVEHSLVEPLLLASTVEACLSPPGVVLNKHTEAALCPHLCPDQIVIFANLTKNLALVQQGNQDLNIP